MINNKVMNNSYIILYNNFLSFNSDAKVKELIEEKCLIIE